MPSSRHAHPRLCRSDAWRTAASSCGVALPKTLHRALVSVRLCMRHTMRPPGRTLAKTASTSCGSAAGIRTDRVERHRRRSHPQRGLSGGARGRSPGTCGVEGRRQPGARHPAPSSRVPRVIPTGHSSNCLQCPAVTCTSAAAQHFPTRFGSSPSSARACPNVSCRACQSYSLLTAPRARPCRRRARSMRRTARRAVSRAGNSLPASWSFCATTSASR